MNNIKRIYLAGPSVFFPNFREVESKLKALCHENGFEGVYPLDGDLDITNMSPQQAGRAIGAANYAHIRSCDAVLADLTPYHGPSADVGTVAECAYAYALGKAVVGYIEPYPFQGGYIEPSFKTRVQGFFQLPAHATKDRRGNTIESFQLYDNCMVDTACNYGIHQNITYALMALRHKTITTLEIR